MAHVGLGRVIGSVMTLIRRETILPCRDYRRPAAATTPIPIFPIMGVASGRGAPRRVRRCRSFTDVLGETHHAMEQQRAYPRPDQILEHEMMFPQEVVAAVRRFARSKPWRGTLVQRWHKFAQLNRQLSQACRIEPPLLILHGDGKGDSGCSYYDALQHTIVMNGRLSVVTFLHEYAHALGMDERDACRWSIQLFRTCFPRSFERCQFDGHVLRAKR